MGFLDGTGLHKHALIPHDNFPAAAPQPLSLPFCVFQYDHCVDIYNMIVWGS